MLTCSFALNIFLNLLKQVINYFYLISLIFIILEFQRRTEYCVICTFSRPAFFHIRNTLNVNEGNNTLFVSLGTIFFRRNTKLFLKIYIYSSQQCRFIIFIFQCGSEVHHNLINVLFLTVKRTESFLNEMYLSLCKLYTERVEMSDIDAKRQYSHRHLFCSDETMHVQFCMHPIQHCVFLFQTSIGWNRSPVIDVSRTFQYVSSHGAGVVGS